MILKNIVLVISHISRYVLHIQSSDAWAVSLKSRNQSLESLGYWFKSHKVNVTELEFCLILELFCCVFFMFPLNNILYSYQLNKWKFSFVFHFPKHHYQVNFEKCILVVRQEMPPGYIRLYHAFWLAWVQWPFFLLFSLLWSFS